MGSSRSWRSGAGYSPLQKLRNAWSGVTHAVFVDLSVRYKLLLSVGFLAMAMLFESLFHFLFLLAVTGMMLMAELFNTVVEALCDYVQPDRDDRIGAIKDMAAAATYIAIGIWCVVLGIVLYELLSATDVLVTAPRR